MIKNKEMRAINLAKTILITMVLYHIIYNTFFGWNMKPINEYEEICDAIFSMGINVAFILYLSPLLSVYEKFIKKHGDK